MTLPAISEKEFMSQVIHLAKLFRWKVAHFRPGLTKSGKWRTAVQGDGKGFVDLVLVRERIVWAEVKTDKGQLTPEQREWIAALERAGQEVHVWRPSDWKLIEEVLR
jgi:hypothetical protein